MNRFPCFRKLSRLAAAAAVCALAGQAQAAVVTFSGLTADQQTLANYQEAGMTVTGTAGSNFWGFPSGGVLHLDASGFNNAGFDFTYAGGAFNLVSVELTCCGTAASAGTWTAYNAGNALVATFAMNAATNAVLNTFSGFTGITRLHLEATSGHFSIDNLTFNATTTVPEPMSLALVGAALGGLALTRRRTSH